MQFEITKAGHLKFIAEADDMGWLRDSLAESDDKTFLDNLLEYAGWRDSEFTQVRPIDVGALTDSPLLAQGYPYDDNGDCTVGEKDPVWFYNDYALRHFGEVLLSQGQAVFHRA